MKISVVTISFNQSEYLKTCIDSVLSQNHPDIEYIVVDPGSKDGSRELISSYGSKIISIFEPDEGPADGLNKGFSKCTGDIFCYLNSDDSFTPGALKKVAESFKKNPKADVIYGHGYIIDEKDNVIRKCYSDRFSLTSAAYGATVTIQPSTFFRKSSFLSVGGFNVSNRSNWDGELFIDFAMKNNTLVRVNNFLSNYRLHSAGITGSGRLEELHRQYSERMFEKIMGRKKKPSDKWPSKFHRIKKHLLHPRATMERLLHGAIFSSKGKP